MRPEMLFTINEYDPNKPDHPITSAWDDTQSKVIAIKINTDYQFLEFPFERGNDVRRFIM